MGVIYIHEETGVDGPDTPGTEAAPFKTVSEAYVVHGADSEYVVKKKGDDEFKPAAKSAMKKAVSYADQQRKKREAAAKRAEKEAQDEAAREAVLEQAKNIKISEDTELPPAKLISLGETDPKVLGQLRKAEGDPKEGVVRVRILGRVQRVAKQGGLVFVTLRRGLDLMQCLLSGTLSKTYDALTLQRETSMEIFGELWEVPEGHNAPLNRELKADFFRIISRAPGGDDALTTRAPVDADPQTLLNLRHLALRHEKPAAVMFVRDAVEDAFHTAYKELNCKKVSPPALVQTQVEGGATLFQFDYYGQPAYLTQSSQLYLETCLPVLGDVYCIEKSFRAEKSLTRRHLSEYTHVEAELDFITFDDLLAHLEEIICRVIDLTLANPVAAKIIKEFNPDFVPPARPFMRMRYSDAIDWLREKGIKNEEGNDHTFGDDIAEAAERKMTDEINRPIFLTHFPAEIKAFYMQRAADDNRVTESVDVLMPGVGEIVGGSMRTWDWDELMAAYKREGIDPSGYYWYTDQRKYGSTPHGGYGLGQERFLAWLLKLWTVREACLYARFMGRCTP
ncbi:hypothetical protein S7711_02911 [Stachybotrys chartarum IBT 7711]|uniref:asparagine--tRNA ligase n=1 Tax=Stachybotrys chartarum (strain CBS 109288 / IBT 7711) TaxID=1280523 RepID=A0A084B297_STACB|nr:hypothetical protein S7711_02911 [Stachybotrys chartarum IBT 7711]KFA56313.1 hypothetical protein S40293_08269 [Stachybotrys chartarum IBT 40293]KFA81964.1 hypothetical protein S40288_04370 [Stachybotrys chartarum IBT 40288]